METALRESEVRAPPLTCWLASHERRCANSSSEICDIPSNSRCCNSEVKSPYKRELYVPRECAHVLNSAQKQQSTLQRIRSRQNFTWGLCVRVRFLGWADRKPPDLGFTLEWTCLVIDRTWATLTPVNLGLALISASLPTARSRT